MFQIRNAISVSGITGVDVESFGGERISDTQATIELEYDGNMTANGTLTVSVGAEAIKDYNGAALTAQLSIPAVTESVTASTAATLTEGTLDESVVTLTLSGRKFERWSSAIRGAVSVSGISGVTVRSYDIDRESDTEVTVKLTFNGNLNADGTLTFTVGADAIVGYSGPALTDQVAVSASTDAPADTGNQDPDPPETPEQPGNQAPPQQPIVTGGTPTITASTPSPLTEASLNGSVVTLTISGGTYARSSFDIKDAVSVSGITGVTFDNFFDVDRVSDTKVTVELTFEGNINADGTLTFTIDVDAIADYNGPALTTRISVTANTESIVASTASPLTEATLHESVITLTLNGAKYERSKWDIADAVKVTGIRGVTLGRSTRVERVSDTKVTVELEFDGTDFDTASTLTFTVEADAIAGYNGPALTTQVSVTAVTESVVASTPAPLKEATLDGSVVTLTLSGKKYARSWDIRDAVSVSGISGVTMPRNQPKRKSDTQITIELEFDGNMNTDGTLTFTVGAEAIDNYSGAALTAQVAVTADRENALLANFPNPFNPETWIPYQLVKPTEVTITIYAIDGKLVRTLVLGHQAAGIYQSRSRAAHWDGRNEFGEPVASGVYFYTITADNFTATRKMLIRK